MNIIDEVRKLNLPLGQYVVFGSGILSAKGIRPAKDIDLLVTPTLFKALQKQGWKRKFAFRRFLKCKLIKKDIAEAFSNANSGSYRIPVRDIITSAEIIDGIPFMNLHELKMFKIQLNRAKDRHDVELIGKYLNQK
jgi:hypothetical protein